LIISWPICNVVRVNEGNVITEFTQESADERLAAADFKETSRRLYCAQNCFYDPWPLHIFTITVHAGKLEKLSQAVAVIANGRIA
jgi:hypothetical protein